MRLITLPCGSLSVNTYIACADGTDRCVVVDPGDSESVLETLHAHALVCTHILLTHGHFDHIGGVAGLKNATGARVTIHEADAGMLMSNRQNLSVLTGSLLASTEPDVLLHGGETFEAAGLVFDVLHTPGHTRGGVCYVLKSDRVVFCGDTVFLDGVGRTDFPGGDQRTLYHSIADVLFKLEGDYALYPGHDEPTTLDHERAHNPLAAVGARLNW